MKELVSGMILVTREYGDLHHTVDTPKGLKVYAEGEYFEFEKENYKMAYIPKSYDDCWTPAEETIINF